MDQMTTEKNAQHFVLSRIDAMGDSILSFPVAGLLKQHFPGCKVSFIVQDFVAPIARTCPLIDGVRSVRRGSHLTADYKAALIALKPDWLFALSAPDQGLMAMTKQLGIKHRVCKLNLRFLRSCNHHVFFSRKWQAHDHEVQFNCQVLRPLGIRKPLKQAMMPWIHLHPEVVPLPAAIESQLNVPDRVTIILHPGSNGHGLEWPLEQFVTLANMLLAIKSVRVILTGSADEYRRLGQQIEKQCPAVINGMGHIDIPQLMTVIKRSDALVASGTGPLHLAAAMGIHTLGLFPKVRAMGVARWGAFGPRAESLETPKNCQYCRGKPHKKALCQCMYRITPHQVYDWLKKKVLTTTQPHVVSKVE